MFFIEIFSKKEAVFIEKQSYASLNRFTWKFTLH
ncbi:hypothetical protein T11_7001 [Trichinella zimbabwensis]|uniref:Uncharacterized protein n=1 Tax=Trichinella zimbabwensis TaxID=268475 RepID=A0A0V1GBK3_9BILA|nr:hypothetical protein T11_7001 [Trichinella zimbabwensis]